ncbi:MOSC N-terminal beta barrel domain-containing protein [Parasphingorhabdus pacifica]
MVVDENGVFRSQRRDPRLALIQPEVSADGARLTLRGEGFEAIRIDIDVERARRHVKLFNAAYTGIDQGETVADWLSEALGAPSRLVRVPPEHNRFVDGHTPATSAYADSSPVHLTVEASLSALNERILATSAKPVTMERFRANIVVEGWNEPHIEDRVRSVVIGDTELAFSKLAIRCAVTMIDQRTAIKSSREPLRTLADYRRTAQGGVAFGTKFAVVHPGTLAVGDEVDVTSWSSSEL